MVFKKNYVPWNKGNRGVTTRNGYFLVYCPEHPFAMSGGQVYQHRLVMEKYLGRYLTKEEHVHHLNGNRKDNRLVNLQLITNSKHQNLTKKTHGLSKTKEYEKISNKFKRDRAENYILKQKVLDALIRFESLMTARHNIILKNHIDFDNAYAANKQIMVIEEFVEDLKKELGI